MISIIIATYNAENKIRLCLESILSQEGCYEIIIIDGGSRDATINIIREYAGKVGEYISEPDNGVYDAWNKGIERAKGEWIMFLGSDDLLTPNALRSYQEFILQNDCSDVDYISSRVKYVINPDKGLYRFIGEKWCWKEFRNRMNVAHVGSLHRKEFFEEVGKYNTNYKIVGDYELLLRKREKLNALFMNEITAVMSTGGISFTVSALKESGKAKIESGGLSKLNAKLIYYSQWIKFKTFLIRQTLKYWFSIIV